MQNIPFSNTKITGGFWAQYQSLVRQVTIRAVYQRFKETGRFAALSCRKGETDAHIYWDSDVAKWIEAAAYLIAEEEDAQLIAIVDEAVEEIRKNQLPCGYFNSHYITLEPENIFTNRDDHELYCAGHLIEAAIAYADATGKEEFLNCMIRYADYIYEVFYQEKSAGFFTPGHPEIELALLRLFEKTGNEKYRTLCAYFIEERGKHREEEESRRFLPGMTLSHIPVRKMQEAFGHAVRACYLYTAMADLAVRNGDDELFSVCQDLFSDITRKKMAVTGGIGAFMIGEAFDLPYRLPNMTSYNETCAAIALTMFAKRLQEGRVCSAYADVIERVLYNGMLSGLSLSGDSFFYENALEIDLKEYDRSVDGLKNLTAGELHKKGLVHKGRLSRSKVFSCSCCPPNLCRIIASAAGYLYSQEKDRIYCHQFMNSETSLEINGQKASLVQETDYPVSGKVTMRYKGPAAKLFVRIPGFCTEAEREKIISDAQKAGHSGKITNGYMEFALPDGCEITVDFPMTVHLTEGSPKVRDLSGKCAVSRGPIIYCMESIDNGECLWDVELTEESPANAKLLNNPAYMVPDILMDGFRHPETDLLYDAATKDRRKVQVHMIPYFSFANRGITDMQIWTKIR